MRILIAVFLVLGMAGAASADYTIEIKNGVGTTIHTRVVTTAEVEHMQVNAGELQGVTVLSQFDEAISNIITEAINKNVQRLRETPAHIAYEEEQARQ